jgi:hypothetical protein
MLVTSTDAYKALRRVAKNELILCISSFYNGDLYEYGFVGSDNVQAGGGSRTSRRNILPPFSGPKNEP